MRTNSFQLGPQVCMVVDSAIAYEHVSPTGRHHRLLPDRARIRNAQKTMSQSHPRWSVDPSAANVGPSMTDLKRHTFSKFCRRLSFRLPISCNAAHSYLVLQRSYSHHSTPAGIIITTSVRPSLDVGQNSRGLQRR